MISGKIMLGAPINSWDAGVSSEVLASWQIPEHPLELFSVDGQPWVGFVSMKFLQGYGIPLENVPTIVNGTEEERATWGQYVATCPEGFSISHFPTAVLLFC